MILTLLACFAPPQTGLVRVWDATGNPHMFSFPKIKDMTVADLATHLMAQTALSPAPDMLCFESETDKDKGMLLRARKADLPRKETR